MEEAITKNLKEAISKLDTSLESLPKQIPVDDIASLNVTFVNDIVLSNSSIGFEINGLFTRNDQTLNYKFMKNPIFYNKILSAQRDRDRNMKFFEEHLLVPSCQGTSKMMGISIDEAVFHSASTLYYEVKSNIDCVYVSSALRFFNQKSRLDHEASNLVAFHDGELWL